MNPIHPVCLNNHQFWLSPERCVFWEKEKTLILSDLHLGKTGHFRKSGIAVPQNIFKNDLHRLLHQLQHFSARQLIIVGDFTHSIDNKELDLFIRWRKDISTIKIILVKGNHDILDANWYKETDIQLEDQFFNYNEFSFCHDPLTENYKKASFTFFGHIHPGVIIHGKGKQSLRFPCFHLSKNSAILPAFGSFTGFSLIAPLKEENVYAIVEKKIVQFQ